MPLSEHSPFHPVDSSRVIYEDENAIAFLDGFPIAPGHTLVVSKNITESIFDLPAIHLEALWRAVNLTRAILREKYSANGFNIGVNDGSVAGQTIAHGHIHVIPRYKGDTADPRGGVRWILPEKARYW